MQNFDELGLSENLYKSLYKMGYTTPTPIQAQAIPLAMKGRDVLGSAQTGTGKTAAFSIPLVNAIMENPRGCAMVLTPTRELAKQVLDVIHQLLGYKSPIKTAFIIGGEPMGKQFKQLKDRPRIIVGTPGRINDHLERGSMMLNDTNFLVLDETDRMLDMGFGVQLDKIVKFLPKNRQTLMFSATLPKGIIAISDKYLKNPERISMGATNVIATNIEQEVIRIEQPKKYMELQTQLHAREGSVIIFIKTKHGADKMAKNLRRDGFQADALHGDLRQNRRDKVMRNFREKIFRILVATDIAARGLDVPHIEHVINYDLPQVAEDYIHRMGRTARAGATGSALSFVASQDSRKWNAIAQLLDPNAKPEREERSGGRKRPHGKKPYKQRGRGGRPDQRPGERFKKSRSGGKPGGFKKNREDRDGEKKSYGDKPRFDKARSNKPHSDRPRADRDGERKSYGDKPRFDKARSNKPHSDRPRSNKPYHASNDQRSNEQGNGQSQERKSFVKPRRSPSKDGSHSAKRSTSKRTDNWRTQERPAAGAGGKKKAFGNRSRRDGNAGNAKPTGNFKKSGFKGKPSGKPQGKAKPRYAA